MGLHPVPLFLAVGLSSESPDQPWALKAPDSRGAPQEIHHGRFWSFRPGDETKRIQIMQGVFHADWMSWRGL